MNIIFVLIILISFILGYFNERLNEVTDSIISSCKTTLDVSLYLIGIMAFWMGIMKIAQDSGLITKLSSFFSIIAKKIFPDLKRNDDVIGDIALNFTANAFGLSNAATPAGLRAMKGLQKINKDKTSASDSMCMLLAMNTAGFQIIPTTIIAILAACGYKNPTNIILPIFIVTSISFLFAIFLAKIFQVFYPHQEYNINKNINIESEPSIQFESEKGGCKN